MHAGMRLVAVVLVSACLCMVALAAGLVWFVNTDNAKTLLLREINTRIPGTITVDHYDISLLEGSIHLRNVTVHAPEGQTLAGAEALLVDLSFTSILKMALIVEAVEVSRPWARLALDDAGRLNLVDAFSTAETDRSDKRLSSKPVPLNIICNHFRLSEGYLAFSDAGGGKRFFLEKIDVDASGDLKEKRGVIKLDVGRAQAAFDGYVSDFKRVHLALALNDGDIEPLVLSAENQFAALLLYGDIRRVFSNPELDVDLKIDTSVEGVASFLKVDRGDTGRLEILVGVKGDPGNPRLDLIGNYTNGRLAGHALERVKVHAGVVDRVVRVESLAVESDAGRLEVHGSADLRRVFAAGFLGPPGDWQEMRYAGRVRSADLDLASIAHTGGVEGTADLLIDVEGRGTRLAALNAAASIGLSIDRFRVGGMARAADVRARAELKVKAGSLQFDAVDMQAAQTVASAAGSFDWESRHADLRFSLENRDIAALLSLFEMTGISGAVDLEGSLSGKMTAPHVQVSAVGSDLHVKGVALGTVGFNAGLDPSGRLDIERLVLEHGTGTLQAGGHVRLFETPYKLHREMPMEARIAVSDLAWERVMPGSGIDGVLGGEVLVSGSVREPSIDASLRAGALTYGKVRLGDVQGKLAFHEGSLLVEKLRLTNNRSAVTAMGEADLLQQGTWQLKQNPEFRLALTDGHLYLEDIDAGLSGKLLLSGDVGGSLKAPTGMLRLEGSDIDLGLQRIASLEVSARVGDRAVMVSPFRLSLPGGGAVEGTGTVGFDRSYRFQLSARDIPAAGIDRLKDVKTISGRLNLEASGEGRLDRPKLQGRADWKELSIGGEAIDDVSMAFSLEENRLSFKGRQGFELDAAYDLAGEAFFVDLRLKDTQLAPWFAVAGRPELGGSASGEITVQGNARQVKRTRAQVDIASLALTFRGDRFAAAQGIRAELENGLFAIPEFAVDLLDQGGLAIKGNGDLAGAIDLSVHGEIPLKAANLLVKDLPAIDGTLYMEATAGGTIQHPEIAGQIRIEKAGMAIPELQQSIHSVQGTLTLAKNEDVLGNISGMLDDGRFDISAVVAMDGFLPGHVEARATVTALPLQFPDTMALLLNADLTLKGDPEDLLIAGSVTMLEGLYYKDFHLNFLKGVTDREREKAPPSVKTVHPLMKPLRFDIHFKHRQPLVVDNNIADLEISPDFLLRGTAENPVLTGAATVVSGVVIYQNKTFEVHHGAVNFINPYRTEAEIDIGGRVEIREWVITISLSGSPDNLVVNLSSMPPEEDADIISLLVFKKTTYELNEGGAGAGQSPTVLLTQLLATSFGRDIEQGAGIDVLEVEAESAADKNASDRIKVTVGKDLSERMTVKYSVESKEGGYVQRASTEYKLLENIVVSGFQDTKGIYGGEFIFRVEFRLFR